MFGKIYNILNKRNSLFTLLISTFMLFLFTSYTAAAGVYGSLDRDRDLDNLFRDYEVLQDYNYYTTGGYDRPNAILLIHKDYELDNPANLWLPIHYVDYNQKKKWISVISTEQDFNRSGYYYAAYILDQNGKRVGVWYSVETFATVKFLKGNKILVYTPELNQNSILGGVDY
ncbi:MAG: hypothetical protein JSW69_05810 [Deltaproteobacteria bacterium]|nr:MAG: hypothetical protein JSW69_05810 [Deltaproteobacteria bacterium]